MSGPHQAARPLPRAWSLGVLPLLAAVLLAAAPDELRVSGQVLYGKATGASKPAVVDILRVYTSNPTYMHMKARGLSQTDPVGKRLFEKAQGETNKALVRAARAAKVDVITVPGGVQGATSPVPDLTAQVIALLPRHYVHGKVLYGRAGTAQAIAVLNSKTVLAAIPEWRDSQTLSENDAQYYLLRKRYLDILGRALRKAARDGGFAAVVEQGGVTSRVGPVPDITAAVLAAVRS